MTNWQLTKGLAHLRDSVNAAWPNRPKTSDGTIGDLAHMQETSGHNPDDTAGSKAEYNDHDGIPEVRAWDCTSAGIPAQEVVDHIRGLPNVSSVLRYIIYNRKIYEASNGWKPRAYTGPSAHTEHIHFSGARTQAADNNTTFNYGLEDLDMPSVDDIVNGLMNALVPVGEEKWTVRAAVGYSARKGFENLQATKQVATAQGVSTAALQAAIGQVDDQVVAKLGDAGQPAEETASMLVSLLGDRAEPVAEAILAMHDGS